MAEEALGILVHGPAGAGKTTLGMTGLPPILLMDAERAARFVQLRKIKWNPMTEAPPVWDGSWDVAVVKTRDWPTAQKALEWLRSGNHPFRTVVVDSISEIQIKVQEAINGRNEMKTQHWGKLLQNMGSFLRDLRDVTDEEDNPLHILCLISTSKDYDGTFKPYLQGSIASQVPYLFDMTAYLYVNQVADEQGVVSDHRFLFTGNHPQYEAKSRVPGVPPTIQDPNLTQMMYAIFPGLRERDAAAYAAFAQAQAEAAAAAIPAPQEEAAPVAPAEEIPAPQAEPIPPVEDSQEFNFELPEN
jgi:hypothetical protein